MVGQVMGSPSGVAADNAIDTTGAVVISTPVVRCKVTWSHSTEFTENVNVEAAASPESATFTHTSRAFPSPKSYVEPS